MPNALPSVDVGRDRSAAIYRVIAAVLAFTVAAPVLAILFTVALVAGLIILVVDAVIGLIRNDHWSGGMLKDWSMRLFAWPFDLIWWIFSGRTTSGEASFPWLP